MFEYFIFIALPVLITLFYLQQRFFHSWRLLLVSTLAIYLGLWTSPAVYGLVKAFFPREMAVYARLCTHVGVILALQLIFLQIATTLSSHGGGGYHLPRSRSFCNLPVCALLGLLYAGLIAYLICLSPLHCKLAKSDSFAQKAVRRMQVFSVIIDRLSLQRATIAQRRNSLEQRVYPRIDPREVAAQKAREIRAAKEAEIKSKKEAAEKAAREAEEKARQEALRQKHRSSKIENSFEEGQYGDTVSDAIPWQPKSTEANKPQKTDSGTDNNAPLATGRDPLETAAANQGSSLPDKKPNNDSKTNNNAPLSTGGNPSETAAGNQGMILPYDNL